MNQPSTEKCQFNFHLPLLLLGSSGNGDGDDRDIGNEDGDDRDIGNEDGDDRDIGNEDGDDRDIGNEDRSVSGDSGNGDIGNGNRDKAARGESGDSGSNDRSVDRDGNGNGLEHNYQQAESKPHPYPHQLLREGGSTGNRAFEALNTWLTGAQALADRELDDELFNSVFQVIFGLSFPSPHLPSFRHYWGEQSDRKRQFYQPAIPHLPIPRALAAHLELNQKGTRPSSRIKVFPVELEWAQWISTRHHYLHKRTIERARPVGYCISLDGLPVGMLMVRTVGHTRQKGLFWRHGEHNERELLSHWQVLCLSRVWVHPAFQNLPVLDNEGNAQIDKKGNIRKLNIASCAIAKLIKRIEADWNVIYPSVLPQSDSRIGLIMTYCDPVKGFKGTIYRASGFEEWVDQTQPKQVYNSHNKSRGKGTPYPLTIWLKWLQDKPSGTIRYLEERSRDRQ